MLLFEEYIKENKPQFIAKLINIAEKLNVSPDWLSAIMFHESRLNSHIQNSIGATGLIQFMPATARNLGTTPAALVAMSNVEQLDYVYKYFAPYKSRIKSAYDLFLITFLPVALGQPDNYIFAAKNLPASIIASQNKIFDLDKNGAITMKEYKEYLKNWFAKYGVNIEKKKE